MYWSGSFREELEAGKTAQQVQLLEAKPDS